MHPSAAGRAQDKESSPARDRRSITVPRHQLSAGWDEVIYLARHQNWLMGFGGVGCEIWPLEIFDVYGRSTYRCTGRPVWINTPASSAASAKASAAWRNCLERCPPVVASFYCRAMLCMRGTSHGPVSVCLSVCHKSEFY